ncbi:hypothetical protein [Arthrobacter sp. NPDC090010]|uniref:hypothetical protein n=1 Tax=Arthrobacter sp. NPDC090010 TaxID=3363942 RepID=UPI00380736CC
MSLFTALATSKVTVSAAALGVITLGGVGTAAYAGSLPTPVQDVAHQAIGAPAPIVKDAKSTATDAVATAKKTVTEKTGVAKDAVKDAVAKAQEKAASLPAKADQLSGKVLPGTGWPISWLFARPMPRRPLMSPRPVFRPL